MDLEYFIARFSANARVIDAMTSDVDDHQARWKPAPEKWSILDVVCHLCDEERSDFRARIRSTLEDPSRPWEPIDPEGWVKQRHYDEQKLGAKRVEFWGEREASLEWLRTLDAPSLDNVHVHPQIGRLTAGDILTAWLAHDYLHMRQLARLHYEYLEQLATPHKPDYAGGW